MSWVGNAVRAFFGLAWEHRWAYALPIVTLLLVATIYAVRLPDTFEARAVVRAREMSSGDTPGSLPSEQHVQAHATVATVHDRLITEKNLEAIIPVLMPGENPRDLLALEKAKDRAQFDRLSDFSFAIRISDTDPERASNAVNALLRAFLENERDPLIRRARDRHTFYREEARKATEVYSKAMAALEVFRAKNSGTLPEMKDLISDELATLRNDVSLQTQLGASARRRAEFLSQQITRNGGDAATSSSSRMTSADEKQLEHQLSEQQKALDDARKRLANARTRYTDKMPIVVALRSEVSVLGADVKATVVALRAARQRADKAATAKQRREAVASLSLLKEMRRDATEEVERTGLAVKQMRKRMKILDGLLARIPATAAAMIPLKQALAEADKRRDALQSSANRAAERENYFTNSSPEDVTPYSVAAWAVPPAKPSGPKRMLFLLSAIAIGALIGYALMLLRRRFEEPAIRRPDQIHDLFPAAMIVSVPLLGDGRPTRRFPWLEIVPAMWVITCFGTTLLVLAAHKGWMQVPSWLTRLMGGGA